MTWFPDVYPRQIDVERADVSNYKLCQDNHCSDADDSKLLLKTNDNEKACQNKLVIAASNEASRSRWMKLVIDLLA